MGSGGPSVRRSMMRRRSEVGDVVCFGQGVFYSMVGSDAGPLVMMHGEL